MPAGRVTPNPDSPISSSLQLENSLKKPESRFVFAVCQHGTETRIKSALMGTDGPYRLAFSRPGFLTFKISDRSSDGQNGVSETGRSNNLDKPPEHVLIRQSGWAFGQLKGTRAEDLVAEALSLAGNDWQAVHVFARDRSLPGSDGFEPIQSELCKAVSGLVKRRLPNADCSGEPCVLGSKVLDLVLVEPDQWFAGHHLADRIHKCWPGGVLPIQPPSQMIARAYLKVAEAIAWSGLPIQPGDSIVEIGSAPGGACQRLLDLGLEVTGIDPAEMDPAILEHPRFEFWRGKSSTVKRKQYAKFKWLVCDANVAPNYTLDAVEDVVTYKTSQFAGLLLTLKLSSYELLDELEQYLARIREWGFKRVRARQLGFNRRELCVCAARDGDLTPG